MKLIDLLVQELPKHGGWPEGAIIAVDYLPVQMGTKLVLTDKGAFFRSKSNERVTREQYEAALAASQRCVHEWIPSEGRTSSGVLCRKCGDYDGPGEDEKMKESNSQVWDGEGLPPVGCECEVSVCGGWEPGRIVFSDENIGVAYVCESSLSPTLDCVSGFSALKHFRPIRSEADRKREIGVIALATACGDVVTFKYGDRLQNGELFGAAWYELYDKIAAGEVAGIRIE